MRNNIINFLDNNVYKKSPRYFQLKEEYDKIISSYGFSDDYDSNDEIRMDKILSLLEEEGRFCKNYMPSDVYEDIEYWIERQKPLHKSFIELVCDKMQQKEVKIKKIEKKEKEIKDNVASANVDLVRLLGYSNGSGITRMLNACSNSNKNTFLRMKPYNVVERSIAISMLEAMIEVASKDKITLIKKTLEVIYEQE